MIGEVELPVMVRFPPTTEDAFVPVVTSYVNAAACPLVLPTIPMAVVWLMLLFDLNVMLPPTALLVIVPVSSWIPIPD